MFYGYLFSFLFYIWQQFHALLFYTLALALREQKRERKSYTQPVLNFRSSKRGKNKNKKRENKGSAHAILAELLFVFCCCCCCLGVSRCIWRTHPPRNVPQPKTNVKLSRHVFFLCSHSSSISLLFLFLYSPCCQTQCEGTQTHKSHVKHTPSLNLLRPLRRRCKLATTKKALCETAHTLRKIHSETLRRPQTSSPPRSPRFISFFVPRFRFVCIRHRR